MGLPFPRGRAKTPAKNANPCHAFEKRVCFFQGAGRKPLPKMQTQMAFSRKGFAFCQLPALLPLSGTQNGLAGESAPRLSACCVPRAAGRRACQGPCRACTVRERTLDLPETAWHPALRRKKAPPHWQGFCYLQLKSAERSPCRCCQQNGRRVAAVSRAVLVPLLSAERSPCQEAPRFTPGRRRGRGRRRGLRRQAFRWP